MVATGGQTGSDGPVTSTTNTTAGSRPVRPIAAMVPATKAGPAGRSEARAMPVDPTGSATEEIQARQTGSGAKSTLAVQTTETTMVGHR